MPQSILKLVAKTAPDLLVVRYRTKQIANLIELSPLEKNQLVTAVSEITRNAINYAGQGKVEYKIIEKNKKQFLEVSISDNGPGINGTPIKENQSSSGLTISKKLVDEFTIDTIPDEGTTVTMLKSTGKYCSWISDLTTQEWIQKLKDESPFSVVEDLEQQNKQLIDTLEQLERTRDQLEERTAQLNQANKYKGEFLANMSHEIRTPMNAIIGMSNIIDRTELTKEQQKYVKLIKDAGNSLLDIINDILDFSKIEAGKIVIENIEFDLKDLVETCTELLAGNAFSKNIGLLSWLDSDIPESVQGDPVRIRQILVNLINNAIKFTSEGEVIARVKLVESDGNNLRIRFEVKDTGIGLTEEQQNKLFKPFVQADGSTTRQYGGTGLGLSISKQLSELMHGKIGVESVSGAGSTFWFELPFQTVKDATETKWEKLPYKKALIVDDHPAICELLSFYLDSWQIETHTASGAQEALKAVEKENFDLFIIDYLMPAKNGLELTRELRENAKTKEARIVLLTALHDENLGKESIQSGCNAFLTKPVRQNYLRETLQSIIDSDVPVEQIKATQIVSSPTKSEDLDRSEVEPESTTSSDALIKALLVEDNPTNQIVAGIELKNLNVEVTTANNGKEAVEYYAKESFDMIFMDCQMPVMDGFEATKELRKMEAQKGSHVPIIAMTANAMAGDREKCLAVGMDDYITKPFETKDLKAIVNKWLSGSVKETASENDVDEEVSTDDRNSVLNLDLIKEKFDENQSKQLMTIFITDTESRLSKFTQLVEERDLVNLGKQAHAIKGAASMIFANALAEVAREMELSAKESDDSNLEGLHKRITDEFDKLKEVIKNHAS